MQEQYYKIDECDLYFRFWVKRFLKGLGLEAAHVSELGILNQGIKQESNQKLRVGISVMFYTLLSAASLSRKQCLSKE